MVLQEFMFCNLDGGGDVRVHTWYRLQTVTEALRREKDSFQSVVVRTLTLVTDHKQTVQKFIAECKLAVTNAAQ